MRGSGEYARGLGVGRGLDPQEHRHGVGLDGGDHGLKHRVALMLVLHQRVTLAVGAQMDPLAQRVHHVEMIFPFRINHREQDAAFQLAHQLVAHRFLFPAIPVCQRLSHALGQLRAIRQLLIELHLESKLAQQGRA